MEDADGQVPRVASAPGWKGLAPPELCPALVLLTVAWFRGLGSQTGASSP